jgi:hypothetical protein
MAEIETAAMRTPLEEALEVVSQWFAVRVDVDTPQRGGFSRWCCGPVPLPQGVPYRQPEPFSEEQGPRCVVNAKLISMMSAVVLLVWVIVILLCVERMDANDSKWLPYQKDALPRTDLISERVMQSKLENIELKMAVRTNLLRRGQKGMAVIM